MKIINLPAGMSHVPCDDLALKISDALWPDDGTDDEGWEINHGCCWIEAEREIKQAVLSGMLPVKKPTTFSPLAFFQGNAWKAGVVTIDDLRAYVADRGITVAVAGAPEPQATLVGDVGASGSAERAKAGPLPLATGDIAFCFAGLRWKTETEWKKPLGDKPKWLAACIVIPGVQGVSETRWSPVCIGAALVRAGHAKPNSVRAKFQTQPLLTPWLDEWKTYEADNSDSN